jgi:hypothetical protein
MNYVAIDNCTIHGSPEDVSFVEFIANIIKNLREPLIDVHIKFS